MTRKAFRRAFIRGREAARNGVPAEACPYEDLRGSAGRVTWSRAYRRAWMDGFFAGGGRQTDLFKGGEHGDAVRSTVDSDEPAIR